MNKRLSLIILIFVTMLLLIACGKSPTKANDGLYMNIEWGTTLEDVQKTLGEGKIKKEDNLQKLSYNISDYEEMEGVDATIACDFEDEGLSSIMILMINGEDSNYTDSELLVLYREKFNKLYGDIELSGTSTDNWESEKK